ncbi:MAG: malonyl-CoA decarboxylase domain-containing protein [Candidatus Rariloculaceae bacterium]
MASSNTRLDDTGTYRKARRATSFGRILDSIVDAGKGLLSRSPRQTGIEEAPAETLAELCQQLLDHRGEPSDLALASEILIHFQTLLGDERMRFFELLSEQFEPDSDAIIRTAGLYRENQSFEARAALAKAVESPRQKLFRRLNMAPDGTLRLVRMRGHLLSAMRERPELRAVDSDLRHLLIAWFNRGFLAMERIDWNSPASILEKIVAYEAAHEITGLEDLRTRLADDRRCYAFFHPAMPGDPLIFVQIALTNGAADAIAPLIASDREFTNARDTDTAVFYSITNCHIGLRGISFGNFLLKQVIEELRHDLENISQFVTLSPILEFNKWISNTPIEDFPEALHEDIYTAREIIEARETIDLVDMSEHARGIVLRLCAYFLLHAKRDGEPVDPVARFHLGNGAELQRINWAADLSPVGRDLLIGIMVNYGYRPKDIERNHEAYFADGKVVASTEIEKLAQIR